MMYYTGSQNDANGTVTQPWLQILDASRGDMNAKWLTGAGGGPDLLYSSMNYVRYGKKGILVAFGGFDNEIKRERSMTDIYIFDIDSQVWYTVTATGDIPTPRSAFCSAVSAAPEDSSFQITVYGGTSEGDSYHIYVLVLPTFQWIDVTPDDRTLGDQDAGRIGFKCLPWKERQLIMIGGFIEPNADVSGWFSTNCTGQGLPLAVLDTSTYQWRDNFTPDQEYAQPRAVCELIGGDFNGGNKKKAPASGFNSSALNTIFASVLPRIEQPTAFTTVVPSSTYSPPLPPPPTPPPASKSKTAVIAGSVVVVIVALSLLAGFVYYYIRRRRRSRLKDMPVLVNPESGSSVGGVLGGVEGSPLIGGIQTTR
ncbi:hypothetical protein AA313_de0205365 [Arthrobotrys entomopaga]|nr:hypothetical protein AA313_de0205365 [Arthrobotrys entomopaga]